MKFLHPINLVKNELQNARIQNLAADPTSPAVGQIYFNTVDQELKVYASSGWDVIGKEYQLVDDILKASIDGGNLKYAPYAAKPAGLGFYTGTTNPDGTTRLNLNGNFYATEVFDAANRVVSSISTTGTGEYIASVTKTDNALTFTKGALPTTLPNPESLVLSFDSGTTEGTDLYTYTGANAKTVNFVGGNLISLVKASNSITINHDALGSAYATTADAGETLANIEILNSLTVDAYGHVSAATFRKLVAGTDLTVTAASNGNITFAHKTFTTTPATTTASPGFGGTATVIDTLTTDNGHITGFNTKTITFPTETQLSLVDDGTGTWITTLAVADHQVTVSRSNTTTATITVGELIITKAADPAQTGDLTVGGDVTISGNLTVQGTTTTLDTETILIKDNIIEINSNQEGTPSSSLVSGIEVNRGDEDNFQFVFVEATDDFRLGEVGSLQPVLTRDEATNLAEGDILIWDDTNNRAVGKTFDELNLPNKFAANLTIATGQTYEIEHNLNTTDVIVSIKDITTGSSTLNEIVYANVKITGANTIDVGFGEINGITTVRITVIG
jgi:hypothetical protein